MEEISKRTKVAGLSMLAGAVVLMVPPFLGKPEGGSDDTKEHLANLVANPTPTMAKSFVFQLGALLLLPGIAAIVGRTRGRGTGAVLSGATAYAAGLIGAVVFMVMTGVEVSLAGDGPISPALADAADRVGSSPAAIPSLVLAFLVFDLIGLPWLAWGMVRARQISKWVAIVATVGTLGAFLGSGSMVEAVARELIGVGLVAVALTLVRPRLPELSPALQPA